MSQAGSVEAALDSELADISPDLLARHLPEAPLPATRQRLPAAVNPAPVPLAPADQPRNAQPLRLNAGPEPQPPRPPSAAAGSRQRTDLFATRRRVDFKYPAHFAADPRSKPSGYRPTRQARAIEPELAELVPAGTMAGVAPSRSAKAVELPVEAEPVSSETGVAARLAQPTDSAAPLPAAGTKSLQPSPSAREVGPWAAGASATAMRGDRATGSSTTANGSRHAGQSTSPPLPSSDLLRMLAGYSSQRSAGPAWQARLRRDQFGPGGRPGQQTADSAEQLPLELPSGQPARSRSGEPAESLAIGPVGPSGEPQPGTPADLRGEPGAPAAARDVPMPRIYQLRVSPQRQQVAAAHGATAETERAVRLALRWLAAHQDRDGRWDIDGFDLHCPANERCRGLGDKSNSDPGVTGLALLAFLGAGHTQLSGDYSEPVRRGLQWLLSIQRSDGDLRGDGGWMYSHALATLALSEAYGMTGDRRLREPLQRSVLFIVRAQHPDSGGWRYQPGMYGDTSVSGWQLLALKSATLAGIDVPQDTWQRAVRWLELASAGRHHGLARYLPAEPVTPTMTAEAMVCRMLLGYSPEHPAVREASEYISQFLPDWNKLNIYYWYYGTLGMYFVGAEHWQRWNERMRAELLQRQERSGHAAGSWDPADDVWGAQGGRIYVTALATLCLETYYRYLPIQSLAAAELGGHGRENSSPVARQPADQNRR